jgi:hypothetical protein
LVVEVEGGGEEGERGEGVDEDKKGYKWSLWIHL